MTKATDPAYPVQDITLSDHAGLTKREIFALSAMQGMLANEWCSASDKQVVEQAVFMADALIEQLNREEGK